MAHLVHNLGGNCAGTWAYQDAAGDEVFRIVRLDGCRGAKPKQYRPLRRSIDGWHIGDPPGLLPLYGLPELAGASTIWVCEGEKCVEILRDLGLMATTNAHGALASDRTDWTPLADKRVVVCPDHDAAGDRHTKGVLENLGRLSSVPTINIVRLPVTNEGDDIEQFVEARRASGVSGDDIRRELEHLADAAPFKASTEELVIVRLSDVTPEIQPYMWEGRIPSASCTLLGGRQSGTKNLFAYDLMARVTTGSPWPDDRTGPGRRPASTILLEAEEHLESSIVPRLAAAGADLSRVHFIKGAPTDNPDRTRLISIQRDVEGIERLAGRLGDVALVVVSPITSYLGSVEQNSNEQVRNEILHPLKTLAETVGCAVLIIKHPNKDWRNNEPLERIGGSAAWTEAMRCVVFIGNDPDEPLEEKNPRRCAMWIKFSIGLTPDPLSWKIFVADSGAPTIRYLSDPVNFSASEMLVGKRRNEERKSKREFAAEWIAETLADSPMTAAALNDAAMTAVEEDRQFSMDAFERARKDMRDARRLVFERKPGIDPAEWWYWLADKAAPDWFVVEGGAGATSANDPRARVDPQTCGTCGS
ncbi:MAG: AAA family ATPase [Phycisphaerales bacterium]|nr:AAA family ATPase [Phycisphaerales bacterium]